MNTDDETGGWPVTLPGWPPTSAGQPAGAVPGEWVLLSYRMPREPSTPRIAIWRKLKRLGVAQFGDGLVALPADARTREHLDWIADEITEAGGTAGVWLARPATLRQERQLATELAAARAAEYTAILAEATAARTLDGTARAAAIRKLRAQLRRVSRRDYFPPPERITAMAAVDVLATEEYPTTDQELA
jgi:hypothetical protein